MACFPSSSVYPRFKRYPQNPRFKVSSQHPNVIMSTSYEATYNRENIYFDSVITLATTSSRNMFVAIGFQMWKIWNKVLLFKHNCEGSATSVLGAMVDRMMLWNGRSFEVLDTDCAYKPML